MKKPSQSFHGFDSVFEFIGAIVFLLLMFVVVLFMPAGCAKEALYAISQGETQYPVSSEVKPRGNGSYTVTPPTSFPRR